ncbi:hypothetical protein ASF63_12310 [Microbacterium sp. Leaf320]|nr:hypothetical protein ASF63_12310 [Microbacterium sp. Leaf320]
MWEHSSMERDDEANFIRRMAELRADADMSQSELARRMAERGFETYSQTTVSRTEKGERPIRLGEARVLAEILGSSIAMMVQDTEIAELQNESRNLQRVMEKLLLDVARSLSRYEQGVQSVRDFQEFPASFEGAEREIAEQEVRLLKGFVFPSAAVALWAVEVARDSNRDRDSTELLYTDAQRIRELASEHGLD